MQDYYFVKNYENKPGAKIHLIEGEYTINTIDYNPKGKNRSEEFKGERKINQIKSKIILKQKISNYKEYLIWLSFECNDGYQRECLVQDRFSNM